MKDLDTNNSMSQPIQHHIIISTNVINLIHSLKYKSAIFMDENQFENVVCKMAAALCWFRYGF